MSAGSEPRRLRIASVQHGDYLKALSLMKSGQQEPYFGMYQSVAAFEAVLSRHDSLIVSLDAPQYEVRREFQKLVGHPFPKAYQKLVGLRWELYARPILRHLERFNPTHVMLRCSTPLGLRVAIWCKQRRIPTIAIFANAVGGAELSSRVNAQWLMNVLRDPIFARVYNYKPTACRSMEDYGLDPAKIFAWEYDGERMPSALPPKRLERARRDPDRVRRAHDRIEGPVRRGRRRAHVAPARHRRARDDVRRRPGAAGGACARCRASPRRDRHARLGGERHLVRRLSRRDLRVRADAPELHGGDADGAHRGARQPHPGARLQLRRVRAQLPRP